MSYAELYQKNERTIAMWNSRWLDPDYGTSTDILQCQKCDTSVDELYFVVSAVGEMMVCKHCIPELLENCFRSPDYDEAIKCKCGVSYEDVEILECVDNYYFPDMEQHQMLCEHCADELVKEATGKILHGIL